MMASMALDGDVRKTLLDRTDAEKVFRPWWDTIEDMLLNTLIALGIILYVRGITIYRFNNFVKDKIYVYISAVNYSIHAASIAIINDNNYISTNPNLS